MLNQSRAVHPRDAWSWRPWMATVLVALAAVGLYLPALQFPINRFDEDVILGNNLNWLRSKATVSDVVQRDAFFDLPARSFYRPVQNLTFLMDARLGKGRTWTFHATNILLHVLAASMLLSLLRGLQLPESASVATALFFTVNPLLMQAVAWTPGRGDLLLAVFSLASMLCLLQAMRSSSAFWVFLMGLSALLAMFSKETGVMLAIVLPYAWLALHKRTGVAAQRLGAVTLMLIGAAALAVLARVGIVGGDSASRQFAAWNVLSSYHVLPEMAAKLFVPWLLQPLAGYSLAAGLTGGFVGWLLVYGAAKGQNKGNDWLVSLALMWYLALTFPGMLYTHPAGSVAYDYLEHRGYAPAMGLAILLAMVLQRLSWRRLIPYAGSLIVLGTVYSVVRLDDFSGARAFAEAAVTANPESGLARTLRGQLRAIDGDTIGALKDLEQASSRHPDFVLARAAFGRLSLRTGNLGNAIEHLSAALRIDPNLPDMASLLGKAHRMAGNLDSAARWYGVAYRQNPESFDDAFNLGSIEAARGNWQRGLEALTRATELSPQSPVAWHNLAAVHRALGATEKACRCWQRSAELGYQPASAALDRYCGPATASRR